MKIILRHWFINIKDAKKLYHFPGKIQMEATNSISMVGSETRGVVITKIINLLLLYFEYSANWSVFPSYLAVSVLLKTHGANNIHRFVETGHLTEKWKKDTRMCLYHFLHNPTLTMSCLKKKFSSFQDVT